MDNVRRGLFDRTMGVMGKSLGLRLARHSLITTNLANMDTPHYKVRDIKFEQAMQEAVEKNDGSLGLRRTRAEHIPVRDIEQAYKTAEKNIKYGIYGEDEKGEDIIDIDKEMTALAKNHLLFNTTVQMLAKEFEILKHAISDGGR